MCKRSGVSSLPRAGLEIRQSSKDTTASGHGFVVAVFAMGPVAPSLADPGVFSIGATSSGTTCSLGALFATSFGAPLLPGKLCVGPRRCAAGEALSA